MGDRAAEIRQRLDAYLAVRGNRGTPQEIASNYAQIVQWALTFQDLLDRLSAAERVCEVAPTSLKNQVLRDALEAWREARGD